MDVSILYIGPECFLAFRVVEPLVIFAAGKTETDAMEAYTLQPLSYLICHTPLTWTDLLDITGWSSQLKVPKFHHVAFLPDAEYYQSQTMFQGHGEITRRSNEYEDRLSCIMFSCTPIMPDVHLVRFAVARSYVVHEHKGSHKSSDSQGKIHSEHKASRKSSSVPRKTSFKPRVAYGEHMSTEKLVEVAASRFIFNPVLGWSREPMRIADIFPLLKQLYSHKPSNNGATWTHSKHAFRRTPHKCPQTVAYMREKTEWGSDSFDFATTLGADTRVDLVDSMDDFARLFEERVSLADSHLS